MLKQNEKVYRNLPDMPILPEKDLAFLATSC